MGYTFLFSEASSMVDTCLDPKNGFLFFGFVGKLHFVFGETFQRTRSSQGDFPSSREKPRFLDFFFFTILLGFRDLELLVLFGDCSIGI